jgi:Big-like domain-containing protein/type IX secretion system substrate protein
LNPFINSKTPKEMKKIFTLCMIGAFTLLSFTSKAQFSENFDGGILSLSGNCWQFTQIEWTSTPGEVINGTGSLYSNPPVNGTSTRDIFSPVLNITSTSLTFTFNYKLSSKISGNATRTIEIGLTGTSNNFTSLQIITLDNNSPVTVQNYSNSFSVTPGYYKLSVKTGGATGDGNTRIIFDDFFADANALYGPVSHCNSAPVAVDDVFTGIIGSPFYGNILTNDIEPNGETMNPAIIVSSSDGNVIVNPNGSFSFIPNIGFAGFVTTFTYRLNDNGFAPMNSNIATVTINFSVAASLPVHLISFQGNMNKNNKVTLQWKVADNQTVSHFEVQRSSNGKDFATIGLVLGSEKTDVENYMFYETVNSTDKVMYRLIMIDKQQDASYSKILVFQNKSAGAPNLIKIFGNPVNDKLTFSFTSSSSQTVDVKVYDMSGRLQLNQKITSYEGSNMVSLPLTSNFKPGFYVVEVNDGTERQIAKFVKQ